MEINSTILISITHRYLRNKPFETFVVIIVRLLQFFHHSPYYILLFAHISKNHKHKYNITTPPKNKQISLHTSMGSLQSPPHPATPQSSNGNNFLSNYRVFAAFFSKESSTTVNDLPKCCIQCYNPCNNTWTHVGSIPHLNENQVLKGFGMVSIGNFIYIIGGLLYQKVNPNTSIEVEKEVQSVVIRYNVKTEEWSNCASLVIPRYDFACTVCENKIYVAGGKSNLVSPRGISLAEMYDPELNEWTILPNMGTLRYKCVGVTCIARKFYVIGGFAEREDSDRTDPFNMLRSSAEVFDIESKKWELVPGMWQLDVPPNQIVAVNGKLFSSGDCLKAWKGHFDTYDGKFWNVVDGSQLETLNPISNSDFDQQLYLTVASIGTHLYLLSGHKMEGEISTTVSTVHVFDTSANRHAWRSLEPIEEIGEKVLCSHCCVVQLS